MIIDACRSGAFAGQDFKPGPMGSRGLGQLAFDKGMKILAATQADNVALEVAKLEHGLATYTLVDEGLAAAHADFKPRDAIITMGEWLRYAVERVPRLHAEIERGKVRALGAVQPRIVLRAETSRSQRDVVHEAPVRSLQRPALFDFSGTGHDILLLRAGKASP